MMMRPLCALSIGLLSLGQLTFPTSGHAWQTNDLVGKEVVVINDLSPSQPNGFVGLFRIHRIYRVSAQLFDPATRLEWLGLVSRSGDMQGYVLSNQIKLYGEALDYYTGLINRDPTQAELYLRRGYLWRDRKEDAIALLDFDKALELAPGYAEAYHARGLLRYDQRRPKNALEDYALAIRVGGSTALLHLAMGEARSANAQITKDPKELDLAIEQYTFALARDPNLTRAYLGRADAYLKRQHADDAAKAEDDYSHAIQSAPKFAAAYVGRGMHSLQKKAYDKALADSHTASALDSKHAPAHRLRGQVHLAQRDPALALASFNEAIKYAPQDAVSILNRGRAHALQDNLDSALSDFDQALNLDRTNAAAYVDRAMARYRKALLVFKSFNTTSNQSDAAAKPDTKKAPATIAAEEDRKKAKADLMTALEPAESDIAKALQLNPRSAPAFVVRGRLREAQDRYQDALRDENTAIWFDPSLGDAYLARAWLLENCPCEEIRDPLRSKPSAQRGWQLLGVNDPRHLEMLTQAHFSAGDHAEAVANQAKLLNTALGEEKRGATATP